MKERILIELRFLLWPDVALQTLIGLLHKCGADVAGVDWNLVRLRGGVRIFLDESEVLIKAIKDAES